MQKRVTIVLFVILALAGIIGGLMWEKSRQFAAMKQSSNAAPVESVTTFKAVAQEWHPLLTSVGTLTAENGITLCAEVAGTIASLPLESGAKVAKGALLAQFDVRVEAAQLQAAEARAELARLGAERTRELRKRDTVAQAELDAAEAQLKAANADVEALRALIERKTFRAPFAGRLGIRQVNLGQFVNSGLPIVTLQAIELLYVDFALPQQNVGDLAVGQEVRVTTDGVAGATFTGKITALDPKIDPATRNIRVRATVANPEEKLRPGMFANVEVVLPAGAPVVVIPSSAVLYAPYGDSIFIVEPKKNEKGESVLTARQAFVRLGVTQGDFVSVLSGVKAGEELVSTGAFKLRNGSIVKVNNGLVPAPSLNPKPENN